MSSYTHTHTQRQYSLYLTYNVELTGFNLFCSIPNVVRKFIYLAIFTKSLSKLNILQIFFYHTSHLYLFWTWFVVDDGRLQSMEAIDPVDCERRQSLLVLVGFPSPLLVAAGCGRWRHFPCWFHVGCFKGHFTFSPK